MHYEEELDLFCRCIRANISIMLHKTIYEINSTLLLRTHFKPPSSVCNNFLLQSHVEFGRLLLLKYAIYIYIYQTLLSKATYLFRLYIFFVCFISMCVPWELNPQPFVLLTQCSTTEPQEHYL